MDNISIDIDCTKITKARLKNGKYLKAILIPTPNNQYGNDYLIAESVTKEERAAGQKGPILGNARILVFAKQEKPKDRVPDTQPKDDDEDIPF